MRLAAAHAQTFPSLNYLHLIATSDVFAVWEDPKKSISASTQRKMWHALRLRYANCEHFGSYERDLDRLFHTCFERRADFDGEMLRLCLAWYDIETPIVRAWRNEDAIDVCKRLDATTYLADADVDIIAFEKGCVRLEWHRFEHTSRDMAALDLLLQYGPRSRDLLAGHDDPPTLNAWLIGGATGRRLAHKR